ncbi:NAD(P)H-binding protein [Confluentibacter lentus]|uniref:NAD(P)H-binding protein n=1 Tax=Confluentibacter lentus TaxID=1699412 RepID=UPI000C28829D|nr:NAD(P)H-binding protein [Confluentibacter lentus]
MKIIITGSLGNIGKPLTIELVKKGHSVIVVSSKEEKRNEIESLGAIPSIGSIEDVAFLNGTFEEADAVFCMVPPADYKEPDRRIYYSRIANNYFKAIQETKVTRVIHLSTFGADLDKGTGILLGAHDAEKILNQLESANITHIRPTYFYYNLNNFIDMIKFQGIIRTNYGGDHKFPMVAPIDIAQVIAEEIQNLHSENKVRYVASDERDGHEIAKVLGAAINKPDLKWEVISNDEVQKSMESYGIPSLLAKGFVDMFDRMYKGDLARDFYLHKPSLGKIKLEDFAKDFVKAYNQV